MKDELYTFGEYLNMLLKKNCMSVTEFAKRIKEKNRTSIYRILQEDCGIDQIIKLKNKIIDLNVMPLTEYEKNELEQAVIVNKYGRETILARKSMFDFLCSVNEDYIRNEEIRIYSSAEEKNPNYLHQLFDMIATREDVDSVEVIMLNSIFPSLNHEISILAEKALEKGVLFNIEHIIQFGDSKLKNVEIMKALTILLPFKNYTCFFERKNQLSMTENILVDSYTVICLKLKDNSHLVFLIKIIDSGHLYVYSCRDYKFYLFHQKCFERIKHYCIPLTKDFSNKNQLHNIIDLSRFLAKYEECSSIYDLGGTPSFVNMRTEILEDIIDDMIKKILVPIPESSSQRSETHKQLTVFKCELLEVMARRKRYSINKPNPYICVEIFCPTALKNFAQTGYLADHVDKLRQFTPKERVAILRDTVSLAKDVKLNYKFFILKRNYFHHSTEIYFAKDSCINLEIYKKKFLENHKITLINMPILIDMFSDFFENEIIAKRVMTDDEAFIFMEDLIKSIQENDCS